MSGNAARLLLEKVEIARRRSSLFAKGDRIVVAVSGGPDSIALLDILCRISRKFSLKLFVAHLHHGLRSEANKAMRLAREAAWRCGVPFHGKRVDVRAIARRSGRTLEEAGRNERYRFFTQVARRRKAALIATAHTRDDQAETVLLRLLRGTGLKGLAGIPVKRCEGRFAVIRPFLSVSKAEILAYLDAEKLRFARDLSNQSDRFTRNRVRRKLLPLMERVFNPSVRDTLNALASICGDAQDFVEREAAKAARRCRRARGGDRAVRLRLEALRRLHPALQAEVLGQAIAERSRLRQKISHRHLSSAVEALRTTRPKLELQLPNGVRLFKTRELLVID